MFSRICGQHFPKFLLFLGFLNVYLIWKSENKYDSDVDSNDPETMHYKGTRYVKGVWF